MESILVKIALFDTKSSNRFLEAIGKQIAGSQHTNLPLIEIRPYKIGIKETWVSDALRPVLNVRGANDNNYFVMPIPVLMIELYDFCPLSSIMFFVSDLNRNYFSADEIFGEDIHRTDVYYALSKCANCAVDFQRDWNGVRDREVFVPGGSKMAFERQHYPFSEPFLDVVEKHWQEATRHPQPTQSDLF